MVVGKVRFNLKTGALTFSGQPPTGPDQAVLAQACREMLKREKVARSRA